MKSKNQTDKDNEKVLKLKKHSKHKEACSNIYYNKDYQMTNRIPKLDPLSSKDEKSTNIVADQSTQPATYESTLIKRNDDLTDVTAESAASPNTLNRNSERFTIMDLSNRNYSINDIFSKISPRRYYASQEKVNKGLQNLKFNSNNSRKSQDDRDSIASSLKHNYSMPIIKK